MENFLWDDQLSVFERIVEEASYTADVDGLRTKVQNEATKLSSGQKMILSIIVSLIKSSGENSMILIDEPELYLYAPYIAALILSINTITNETGSACIMTTHSAITLQEMLRENVLLITSIDEVKKE